VKSPVGIRRACITGLVCLAIGAEAMIPSLPSITPLQLMADSVARDTAFVDTLREVTVMGDSLRVAPVKDAINQSLKRNPIPKQYSLSDVMDMAVPGVSDYILHPFGFKERKKKKQKKRMQKILREYDNADKADSFNHLLDSIMRIEGLK